MSRVVRAKNAGVRGRGLEGVDRALGPSVSGVDLAPAEDGRALLGSGVGLAVADVALAPVTVFGEFGEWDPVSLGLAWPCWPWGSPSPGVSVASSGDPLEPATQHDWRSRGPQVRPLTHTIARQTGTTQAPNARILVSWIVKQDRACSTPTGAFL